MKSLSITLLLLTSAVGLFAQGPFNVSVVPASGSQSYTQTLSFMATWSSPYGAGYILNGMFYMGGCAISYSASTISLLDPDAGAWVSASRPVGFASTRNRICGVTANKAHLEGDLLSLQLLITFDAQAAGNVYPIYLGTVDNLGRVATWEQKGSFSIVK